MWFNWIFIIKSNIKKKISKKIFVYEKSKANILKIKKLRLACVIINDFKNYTKIRFNYFLHTNE